MELIKEGVNPLNTPIDEVREHLKEIASANGATEEERYSNYLAKLQKTDALTSEQRDTYIGVYRLLNNIEKTDGMAIGYLVKSGRELTMNNLLSAIQSIKATGMDTTIDDSFGLLQDLKYETKSISQQLNASFVNLNEFERAKLSYNEQISTKLYNQISPDFLEYANSKGQLMNQSLEQLEQLYQEYDSIYPQGDLASYEEVLTKVQQAMQMTGEIKFLKEHNIKVTLQNILSANHILSPSNQVRSDVSELMGEQEEAILEENLDIEKATSFLEFQMNYEKVMNSTEKYLRESFEHPTLTVESMLAINGYLNDTSLLKDLSHKQFYQVPMNVNGETVQIGLSILSGKNEKGKVSIHLESQTYGTINAQLQLNGKELKGLVVCNHRSMASVLDRKVKEMKDLLPEEIQEMQVHVCAESNVAGSLSFGQVQQEENAQQTQVLFQIAKAFISKVKEYDL